MINNGSVAVAERNSTAEHCPRKLPQRVEGEVATESDDAKRNDRRPFYLEKFIRIVFHGVSSVMAHTREKKGMAAADFEQAVHFAGEHGLSPEVAILPVDYQTSDKFLTYT